MNIDNVHVMTKKAKMSGEEYLEVPKSVLDFLCAKDVQEDFICFDSIFLIEEGKVDQVYKRLNLKCLNA